MREYSPKRRTAVVLTGSGTSGAYHAGALRALDESGVKVDLLVGSGVGTLAAAYGAVAGGARLYGEKGFWDGVTWESFYRLRGALRIGLLLLGSSFGVFLLPLLLGLLGGLLFVLVLIVDLVAPGFTGRLVADLSAAPAALRAPYLAALSVPIFILCALAIGAGAWRAFRDRRRFPEAFESLLDANEAHRRLAQGLWEISRGSAVSTSAPDDAEIGRRYVALLTENLGQPGFRELILRAADLETGGVLPFVALQEPHRATFAAARVRGVRSRLDGLPGAIDLLADGYDALLFDAVLTGLLPPVATPVRRVSFPKGGLHGGETHRLADATLVGGCGITEAVAAGADQVIVVTAAPEAPSPLPRRRGPHALGDGILATHERQAVEVELKTAERINRMVETLGHHTEDGGRGWQDPATGRLFRDIAFYVIRPERRAFGPLQMDGCLDPATEVLETPDDLVVQGYRDAYRLFVEPVVGAVPETRPRMMDREETQAVEL